MNSEITYIHVPEIATYGKFWRLSETELKEIDNLARLMQNPDANFSKLQHLWNTSKKFRLLNGGLL